MKLHLTDKTDTRKECLREEKTVQLNTILKPEYEILLQFIKCFIG